MVTFNLPIDAVGIFPDGCRYVTLAIPDSLFVPEQWPIGSYVDVTPSEPALPDQRTALYCPACRSTGALHCANPESCDGMRPRL